MLTRKPANLSKVGIYSIILEFCLFAAFKDWDMVFADDERESNPTTFKFLQMAHAWKAKKAGGGAGLTSLSGFTASSSTTIETNSETKKAGKTRQSDGDADDDDDSGSDVASSHGGD